MASIKDLVTSQQRWQPPKNGTPKDNIFTRKAPPTDFFSLNAPSPDPEANLLLGIGEGFRQTYVI